MHQHKFAIFGVAALVALAMACNRQSTTPTSPSAPTPVASSPADASAVSSPTATPGATLVACAADSGLRLKATTPEPLSPTNDVRLETLSATLVAGAGATTYVAVAVQHRFQVFDDAGTLVQDSCPLSGTSFTTTVALDVNARYTWRVRAELDGTATPWSASASFRTAEVLPPTHRSPADGATTTSLSPSLIIANATVASVLGSAQYRFVVETNAGAAVINATVASGTGGTTVYAIAENVLQRDVIYRWRARAEAGSAVGRWSAYTTFRTPATQSGYIRGNELFDPLVDGRTVGRIGGSGNVTWVPGQGIRMNDEFAYVVYDLPQVYSSGEMSLEVTGLSPGGWPGKARIFSMLDRLGAIASSSKYSFNVQYRGVGGVPDNCITWKAVLGDNMTSVEAPVDRFQMVFNLDASKVYLWQGFWTPTSFRLVVKEGGTTGPVVYDQHGDATSASNWNPEKMYAFIGTNNGAFTSNDGTRVGMTVRNVWVGSTPRPATLY
jgi:hypothetical protein